MAFALTQQKEKDARDWIASKITEDYPTLKVFVTPWYFSSKQDVIGQIDPSVLILPDADYDKYEVNYVMLSFLRFRDSRDEGCDGNPVVYVRYNLEIFKEFKDVRPNSSNSHDELLALVVALHNKFVRGREHPFYGNNLNHKPLEQFQNTNLNKESPHVAGVFGDWLNLEVEVEAR